MSASLTPNRELARAALWYVLDGALILVSLADTRAAATPPALTGSYTDWTNYLLSSQFDLFLTAGTTSYGSPNTQQAKLQQLQVVLSYNQSVTYTDLVILVLPVQAPESLTPDFVLPFLGGIHESTAVTLSSGQTKTYKLDLAAAWA